MELEVLNALRSPSGVPGHPLLFLILLVLTWTLHILAVYVMLGGTALSLFGAYTSDPHWRRLSKAMLDTAKVAVSIAIVAGVAPLLFVQVVYDPFWYVSNVLSARWVIAFIALLLIAYYAMYHRYFAAKGQQETGRRSLMLSLFLLLIVGFIMHVLTSQMLRPELWLRWYAPGGHIEPSGSRLHEFNLFRYLFFIALSVPVTSAWLSGYARYLAQTPTDAPAYRHWLGRLYGRGMSMGGMIALLFYVLWMSSLPDTARGYIGSFWSVLAAVATLTLAICPLLFRPGQGDYRPWILSAAAILVIAVAREALRFMILNGAHGYDLFSYPVNFDGYGTLLFFLTFAALGGPAIAFSVAISWEAGKSVGVYTASPLISRLGKFTLLALGVWIAQYFLFGFLTLLRG
jgi:hypothetical protein